LESSSCQRPVGELLALAWARVRRAFARFEQLGVPFEAARTREQLAAVEPAAAARSLLQAALSTSERLDCAPRTHAVQARLIALA
jgi:hypothetical protein